MLARKETKYVVVTATMTDDRIDARSVEWRARKYGYLDAGCHYIIEDGRITACRPHHQIGVGARPHNMSSVIIMLSGKPPFTDSQMSALGDTVDAMLCRYTEAAVVGHSNLPGVTRQVAPGFDVAAWWTGYKAVAGL